MKQLRFLKSLLAREFLEPVSVKVNKKEVNYNRIEIVWTIPTKSDTIVDKIVVSTEFAFDMDSLMAIFNKKGWSHSKDFVLQGIKHFTDDIIDLIYSHEYDKIANLIHDKRGSITSGDYCI